MDVSGNVVNNDRIGIQGCRYIYFYGDVTGAAPANTTSRWESIFDMR
jgi:hypothetical protein